MKKFIQFTQVIKASAVPEVKVNHQFDEQIRKELKINDPGRSKMTYEIEHMSQSSSFTNDGNLFIVTTLVINISNPV